MNNLHLKLIELLVIFAFLGISLTGCTGRQGLVGPQGIQGGQGVAGPAGAAGAKGIPGSGYGTHYISIPACAFEPRFSSYTFGLNAWSELDAAGGYQFETPIYLPDGAVIKEYSAWYRGTAKFYLIRLPFGGQNLASLVSIGSDTTPTIGMQKVSQTLSAIVDNQTNAYAVWVVVGTGGTSVAGISGAQITYELTVP